MDQKTIREIMMKIQAPSHEYILNFEKEWNEAVALVKASKKGFIQDYDYEKSWLKHRTILLMSTKSLKETVHALRIYHSQSHVAVVSIHHDRRKGAE